MLVCQHSQGYGFSSGHVWMWELGHKQSWVPKNWSFWTVVLEKTLESPLDCKEMQPVHLKWHQSWVFVGRTDVEAETPIHWSPDAKSWLIWKDPDAGKDWRQEEKRTSEDVMVGWHHHLDVHEFGCTLGVDVGQRGLACCSLWGRKESYMTERLNWTELKAGHLLENLPFALWLVRELQLEWNQRDPWGGCPSPCDSLEVSTALSPPFWARNSSRKDVTSKFNQKTQVDLALR